MEEIIQQLKDRLEERRQTDALRSLKINTNLADFSSNDYLGFASSTMLKNKIEQELLAYPSYRTGSSGSRLLYGNDRFVEELEIEIAVFHAAEAGLIFNSGYDANVGLLSAISRRGTTILCDELIHASIIDGIQMGHAQRHSFRHNDLQHLGDKLKRAKGPVFIVVESIYSMDGDEAPLLEISKLASEYDAALIVDEAHAVGIFGDKGRGLVVKYGLTDQVFARTVTFGKALGTHGAIVLGSRLLCSYLVNFARSFIYTTAAPFYNHLSIQMAYRYLAESDHSSLLFKQVSLFKEHAEKAGLPIMASSSPIQCMLTAGNPSARSLEKSAISEGFDIRAILSPTVPAGKERLRICIHSFNTEHEIHQLTDLLKTTI